MVCGLQYPHSLAVKACVLTSSKPQYSNHAVMMTRYSIHLRLDQCDHAPLNLNMENLSFKDRHCKSEARHLESENLLLELGASQVSIKLSPDGSLTNFVDHSSVRAVCMSCIVGSNWMSRTLCNVTANRLWNYLTLLQ